MLRTCEGYNLWLCASWAQQQVVPFSSRHKHFFHRGTLRHCPHLLRAPPETPYMTLALTPSTSNCTITDTSMHFVFFPSMARTGGSSACRQCFKRRVARKINDVSTVNLIRQGIFFSYHKPNINSYLYLKISIFILKCGHFKKLFQF